MSALGYAILVALAIAVLAFMKEKGRPLDHDPGPAEGDKYPLWDKWSKWHLLGSVVLGFLSCALGVPPVWALVITVMAGVGWEVVHGHIDRGDLLWDAVGATAGVLLGLLV